MTTDNKFFTLEKAAPTSDQEALAPTPEQEELNNLLEGDALISFQRLQELQSRQVMTPLQKSYNELFSNPEKLTQAILVQMQSLITRSLAPTFDNLERTATGMVITANLTPENLEKYRVRWSELEAQLMGGVSNDTSGEG